MNRFNPYALVSKLKSLSDDLDALQTEIDTLQTEIDAFSPSTTLTPGQIVFPDSSSKLDGDSNLFWDDTNKRQGIGTNTPERSLEIKVTDSDFDTIRYPLRVTHSIV